ncbi:hypothetical protein NC652_015555 [Populus alba x Populus x berolinensis]|nr:hypothetical protein NC652_015555 [Populus alba x Populus x berolinensis]
MEDRMRERESPARGERGSKLIDCPDCLGFDLVWRGAPKAWYTGSLESPPSILVTRNPNWYFRDSKARDLLRKGKLFSFLFSACVGLLSGQAAARLEKNEGVAATLKAGWRQSGGRLLVAAHERRLSSLFTVEPGLSQCWTCCRRGADEDKLAKCKAIMRKGWESVRLKREGKLVCRGKVLAEEGAVTAVGRRALGLKVCWGKQQQRRKFVLQRQGAEVLGSAGKMERGVVAWIRPIEKISLIDTGGFNRYYLIFAKASSHSYSKFQDSSSLTIEDEVISRVFPSSPTIFFSSLSSHMHDLTFLAEHKLTVFSPNQEAIGAALPLHNSHHCSSPFLS